ncbi:MAG: twin-arginine translocation signal domain-containing protein, partial [Zoogloea sp.]
MDEGDMDTGRRGFLQGAGALGLAAATSALSGVAT